MKKIAIKLIVIFSCIGLVCTIVPELVAAAAKPVVKNYGLHDTDGYDRYGWMKDVKKMYECSAKPNATVKNFDYFASASLLYGMKTSSYLNIHTHGRNEGITSYSLKCVDSSKKVTYLSLSKISGTSKTEFSNLNVAYIGACESAKKFGSFAEELYRHGAKCTIGYRVPVKTKCNYHTIGAFNLAFSTRNATVASAMSSAIKATYNKYGKYGDVDSYVIYGNKNLKYK